MYKLRLLLSIVLAIAIFFAAATTQSSGTKSDPKKVENPWSGRTVELPLHKLKAGIATISVDIEIPRGYHFTDEAPCTLKWKSGDDKVLSLPKDINKRKGTATFPVQTSVTSKPGATELTIDAMVFFCENGSKLCQMDNVRIKAPIEISTTGQEKITLSVEAGEEIGTE